MILKGVTRISVTGMIFGGLKLSILGIFLVRKFGKYFFGGWLDVRRDFWGY